VTSVAGTALLVSRTLSSAFDEQGCGEAGLEKFALEQATKKAHGLMGSSAGALTVDYCCRLIVQVGQKRKACQGKLQVMRISRVVVRGNSGWWME